MSKRKKTVEPEYVPSSGPDSGVNLIADALRDEIEQAIADLEKMNVIPKRGTHEAQLAELRYAVSRLRGRLGVALETLGILRPPSPASGGSQP